MAFPETPRGIEQTVAALPAEPGPKPARNEMLARPLTPAANFAANVFFFAAAKRFFPRGKREAHPRSTQTAGASPPAGDARYSSPGFDRPQPPWARRRIHVTARGPPSPQETEERRIAAITNPSAHSSSDRRDPRTARKIQNAFRRLHNSLAGQTLPSATARK